MRKRSITDEMIRDALRAVPLSRNGKRGPARLYRSPQFGIYVLIDVATDEIFHLGKPGYRYDDA